MTTPDRPAPAPIPAAGRTGICSICGHSRSPAALLLVEDRRTNTTQFVCRPDGGSRGVYDRTLGWASCFRLATGPASWHRVRGAHEEDVE